MGLKMATICPSSCNLCPKFLGFKCDSDINSSTDTATCQIKIISRFKASSRKIFRTEFYHSSDEKNMTITT